MLQKAVASQKTGLKAIARVKNMFLENKREKRGLYSYADIKLNVLFEIEGKSMICEVQFLMDFMIKAKKLGHSIYEIQRTEEFIKNTYKLIHLYTNPTEELKAIALRNDGKALGKFVVNNPRYNLIEKGTDSLVHALALAGNTKGNICPPPFSSATSTPSMRYKIGLLLLLSTFETQREKAELFNLTNADSLTPLMVAMSNYRTEFIKTVLLREIKEGIDLSICNSKEQNIIFMICEDRGQNEKKELGNEYLKIFLKYYESFGDPLQLINTLDTYNRSPLAIAIDSELPERVQILLTYKGASLSLSL